MPVDPTISMGVGVPQPGGALGGGGAMQQFHSFATTLNALNQNQLFQQTFAARQRAGQIMSSAPDTEAGYNAMLRDPLVAPFAGSIVNEARQAQLTMLQIGKVKQEMSDSAFTSFLKSTAGAYNDPSMFDGLLKAHMQTWSPETQKSAGAAALSLRDSLLDGMPTAEQQKSDPRMAQMAQNMWQTRLTGLMVGSGLGADVIRGTTGTMPPAVDWKPTGAGGALEPHQVGSAFTGPPGANLQFPASQGGGTLALPPPSGGAGPLGMPAANPAQAFPGGVHTGLSKGQEEYTTHRYKQLAEDQGRLDQDVTSQGMIQQVLQEARGTLKDFRPGAGAEIYMRLGQTAQALGAPQELVDKISNGNLAATQEFGKLMVNNVMAQIKSQLPSGSRLAQYEFRVFEQRNPNISTDPRAIEKIFAFWDKLYNRTVDEQASLNGFLRGGGDISAWPAEWQKQAKAKGYITPGSAGPGGVIGAGPALAEAPAAAAATHRWDPQKGGLVPVGASP